MRGKSRQAETYSYKLTISHETVGVFREATADVDGEIVDLGEPERVSATAGKTGNITLKRGIDTNKSLWRWFKEIDQSGVEAARADAQIQLLDADGSPIATYTMKQGWPNSIEWGRSGSERTAKDETIESVEIAHEGLYLE